MREAIERGGHSLSIRRKLHVFHWFLEIDVMKHDAAPKVDEHRMPAIIDGQQQTCIRREGNDRDVPPVLKWERPGPVAKNDAGEKRS